MHNKDNKALKGGFSRTGDELIKDVLQKIMRQRNSKITQHINLTNKLKGHNNGKQIAFTNKATVQQQFMHHNIHGMRHQGVSMTHDPSLQSRMDLDQMDPMMHMMMRQNGSRQRSIQSIGEQIQRNVYKIQQQTNNFKINSSSKVSDIQLLKVSIKNYFTQDLSELSYQLNAQVNKFKQLDRYNDTRKYLQIINSRLRKRYQALQAKIKLTFQNAINLVREIKNKKKSKFDELENQLEKIQLQYFEFTKTKLMSIAISERLEPPISRINYQKVKKYFKTQELPPIVIDKTSSMYRTCFNQKSFTGLLQRGWVHNSVIDNYIEYLKVTQGYNKDKSKVAIYSFGESQMFENAKDYRFNDRRIFTNFERIGLVINYKDEHWFFIGVLPKKGKLIIYDSIPRSNSEYLPYLQRMRKFIRRQQQQYKLPHDIILNQIEGNTPKQQNGSDCGIHVICNLTHFLNADKDEGIQKISFSVWNNLAIRAGMYHFMAYLLNFSRNKGNKMPNYGWLQYCSRSAILKPNGEKLWS